MVRGAATLAACLVALCVSGGVCSGQEYTPPPPPLTTLPPCPASADGKPVKKKKQKDCDPSVYPSTTEPTKGKKSDAATQVPSAPATQPPAAQQFPFPGEQPAPTAEQPAAKAFPYPGEGAGQKASDADVQHDPAAEKRAADTPAGKTYPFPGGSTPDMPADPDAAPSDRPPAAGTDSSGSSSSSSSNSASDSGSSPSEKGNDAGSSSGPKGEYDDDESSAPKPKDHSSRGKKVEKPQTDDERVDEDLSVAKFYIQSGNIMGAYLRAKDAVKINPDYAEAHFSLGDAARRLGKKDEATAEFHQYLKLAPDGERAKASERALDELH